MKKHKIDNIEIWSHDFSRSKWDKAEKIIVRFAVVLLVIFGTLFLTNLIYGLFN